MAAHILTSRMHTTPSLDKASRQPAALSALVWEGAVASSSNGIFVTDESTTGHPIVYVNPAFERITGLSAADVLGRSPDFLFGADDTSAVRDEMVAALHAGQSSHGTISSHRKDGRPVWTELSLAPIREVSGALMNTVGVLVDITERKADVELLSYLAYNDSLTRLPNRRLFHDRLTQAIAHARRHDSGVAVLFLDLDNFKIINDTFRHHTGDQLLKAVGERITGCLRKSDTAARVGGDEFTVVLPEVESPQDAAAVAQKIIDSLKLPFQVNGVEVFVGGSVGIALYPADGQDVETLVKAADAAMYHAKAEGRSQFQFYSERFNAAAVERLALETSLRFALEREEFLLDYQPQVDMGTGRIVGMEALIRWRHPELGILAPAHFIPLAEETGLIVPIGEWVLRTACAQAKAWQRAGFAHLIVTVNISSRQFRRTTLAETVRGILAEADLDPRLLELEITETAVMHDVDAAIATLHSLKALGCHIAVDDFGTGYSSLSYLSRFPVDNLKIDQSFVRDLDVGSTDARTAESIVTAIISLARSSSMCVIAEGVETAAQFDFLRARQCDRMQGFHFSPAISPDALMALLLNERATPLTVA